MLTPVAHEEAAPLKEFKLADPTPDAVLLQQAYVYLFLVETILDPLHPIEKIPRVLFPAAVPDIEETLDDATPQEVFVHVAYVYLFLVEEAGPASEPVRPNAKIPRVELPVAEP